jgi:hypothetical protein
MTGYVYTIYSESRQLVKIGCSTQPKERLRLLQLNDIAEMWGQWASDSMYDDEKALHHYFLQYHVRDEWFDLPIKAMDDIGAYFNGKLDKGSVKVNNSVNVSPKREQTCLRERCGYKWVSRKANPVECPRCKSYLKSVSGEDAVEEAK